MTIPIKFGRTIKDLKWHVDQWLATADTDYPDELICLEQKNMKAVSRLLDILAGIAENPCQLYASMHECGKPDKDGVYWRCDPCNVRVAEKTLGS